MLDAADMRNQCLCSKDSRWSNPSDRGRVALYKFHFMGGTMPETSRIFVELGVAIVGLAILARLASRWASR